MLLESQPGIAVVAEATTRAEALAAAYEHPDVIILDLDLGGEIVLDCIPELLAAAQETRILILTGVRDPDIHRRAVSLGAIGLVPKEKAATDLLQAIEKICAGEAWLEPTLVANVLNVMTRTRGTPPLDPEATKIATLTEREREVITLVGQGLRNKPIAEHLYISETTVRHHLTAIFAKLEVTDRLGLMIYAYRHGLASVPR
jgi:DNA-binding NarL/FixJ family response regulator